MLQDTDIQMLLYRARLLLEEGRNDAALAVLQTIHTQNEKQLRDVAYLLGWCYIQRKQWDEAMQALAPLLDSHSEHEKLETPLERERLALYLLRLGQAAVKLAHYEDASLHFTICLKMLHDRRVHLPLVRIQVRYLLAMTCAMRGLCTIAIQQYAEALRLCRHYHDETELPHIYRGLCEAYQQIGDLINASLAGQQALRLYQKAADQPMEAQIHTMLGHIRFQLGDFKEAGDHYTESLTIARSYDKPTLIMLNCAALAELRLAEGHLEEARSYCQLALETMERTDNPHMQGKTYYMIGKVSYEEAKRSEGAHRHALLEETITWYEKARKRLAETQAYADIAEVYSSCAQTLEELGRVADAIEYWRSGYEILSQAKEITK